MGLPNAPREGGNRRAYTHAPYVKTQKGEHWRAWVAGPCQWFACHTSTRTKPCLDEMTGGELSCPFCSAGKIAQVIGYQPLYREVDTRPVHVIVFDLQREHVEKLKLHQMVTVGRGTEATDTVYLAPLLAGGRPYQSTLAERMRPVDLTETLLKMWALPELMMWYRQTQGQAKPAHGQVNSDSAVSLANRILDGEPGTIADAVTLALGARGDEVSALARRRDALRRGEEAARNGNGKKPHG